MEPVDGGNDHWGGATKLFAYWHTPYPRLSEGGGLRIIAIIGIIIIIIATLLNALPSSSFPKSYKVRSLRKSGRYCL